MTTYHGPTDPCVSVLHLTLAFPRLVGACFLAGTIFILLPHGSTPKNCDGTFYQNAGHTYHRDNLCVVAPTPPLNSNQ